MYSYFVSELVLFFHNLHFAENRLYYKLEQYYWFDGLVEVGKISERINTAFENGSISFSEMERLLHTLEHFQGYFSHRASKSCRGA